MAYRVQDVRCGTILLMERHHPLLSGPGALDTGITVSTVNPFDHSALVVVQEGALVIVEALLHVTVSPLDKYVTDGWAFSVPLTGTQEAALSHAALSKVGQCYGVAMVWQDFLRDDLHVDVHPRLDPYHLDCSGLVVWSFAQAGVVLTHAPVPSPADLSYSPVPQGIRPWPA